jgi:hypothetical protein
MATPKLGYFTKSGEKVPGTTTVIGRFKESGGLVHWAWKLGMEGKNYREVRDDAANSGTIAHDMVEAFIRQKDYVRPPNVADDVFERAQVSFGAFEKWAQQTHLKPVDTECGLVSETYKYGGTLDAMLVDGKLALGDWKTSNALYQDYLLQLAAYKNLWEENYPDRPVTGGLHLIRFDKEYGDFTHRWFPELDDAWRQFKLFRQAYDLDIKLKQRIRG